MYALVQNGEVAQIGLPTNGVMQDGATVSNYYCLPPDILKAEGWKPVREVRPDYDIETQYLDVLSTVDNGDEVVMTYVVVDIPLSETEELENLLLEEMGV